jgi:hypothetical protein
MIAPDPFDTEVPIGHKGRSTYQTIADRLAGLNPPVRLERHIQQVEYLKHTGPQSHSSLEAKDSTLDGINFVAEDPRKLVAELEAAKDGSGSNAFASMKEDPDHWALRYSFKKTVGTGFREIWRPSTSLPSAQSARSVMNPMLQMRFGNAGIPVNFTALHCGVEKIGGKTNIHIDETGFVLEIPSGFAVSPNMLDHTFNELLLKTDLRNWLVGKLTNEKAKRVFEWVFDRLSFQFPTAANGFAGLDTKIKSLRLPKVPLDALITAGKLLAPTGVHLDVYKRKNSKVQITGSVLEGNSVTITYGGQW